MRRRKDSAAEKNTFQSRSGKAAANHTAQKQNDNSTLANLANTSPTTLAQLKMQEMADNSPKVKQLDVAQKMADQKQVVQRFTFKEVKKLSDKNFAMVSLWLKARLGDMKGKDMDDNNWNRFLEPLDLNTVLNLAYAHQCRTETEHIEPRIDEVIGVDLNSFSINWKTVVMHLQESSLKPYTKKLDKDNSPITVLDDSDFTKAHMEELRKIRKVDQLDEETLFEELRQVDLVNGFHSQIDGRIYLRKTAGQKQNYDYAIHEAIHECSSPKFAAQLGHPLNEAATELLAQKVCAERGIKNHKNTYAPEIAFFKEIMPQLGLKNLEAAYFNGDIDSLVLALKKLLKTELSYNDFLHAITASKARFVIEIATMKVESLDSILGGLPPLEVSSNKEQTGKEKINKEGNKEDD